MKINNEVFYAKWLGENVRIFERKNGDRILKYNDISRTYSKEETVPSNKTLFKIFNNVKLTNE